MITNRVICYLATALLSLSAFADGRIWEAGALTRDDFKGHPATGIPSYFNARLALTSANDRANGEDVVIISTQAVMDPTMSFVADSVTNNGQRMRLHQIQFDILEKYRRDLQNDINSGMTGIQADERLKYYNNLYKATVDKIMLQTDSGRDEAKLQEWEYYARKGLEETPAPRPRTIHMGNFRYGFYLGTGGSFSTSSLNDAFSGSWTFTGGLQFMYRRIGLKADITYGQPHINSPNVMGVTNQLTTGRYASWINAGIQVGYAIYDSKKFTIMPAVGCAWNQIGWNVTNFVPDEKEEGKMKPVSQESPSIRSFNWKASIDFEYHFYTSLTNSIFNSSRREQFVSSIRFTPFISKVAYNEPNPQLRGYFIGFTVSYSGMARSLGL